MSSNEVLANKLSAARKHIEKGNLHEALKVNTAVLAARPKHMPALLQASRIEGLLGNYRKAREFVIRASQSHSNEIGGVLFLIRRLRAFNLDQEIRDLIDRLPADKNLGTPLFDAIGTALNQLNHSEHALEFINRGLEYDPHSVELLLTRSHTLTFLGRFAEAEQDLDFCIEKAPGIGFGWWTRSRLRRQTNGNNHVKELQKQISVSGHDPQNTAFLAYGLHKEFDDLGETEQAFKALDLACRAKRAQISYSSADTEALISALIAQESASASIEESGPNGAATPIFIVGMHRSGTTLLEQLLDGHPQVKGLGELYNFTTQMRYATDHACKGVIDAKIVQRASGIDFQKVGAAYLDSVAWRRGSESHFTDKLPSNFLNIGFICQALPSAKILHLVRDPMETCFSNLRELFADNTNHYSYDQIELGQFHIQYERLMKHWRTAYPGRIHDVHYANLTRDTENTLKEAADFCGLPFDSSMLALDASKRSVTTASAVQVREGVVARERPKWSPYADYLKPLSRTLSTQ